MPLSNFESTLSFSPQLAATIGLEEAIVFALLEQTSAVVGQNHCDISCQALQSRLTFIPAEQLQRVLKQLADLTLITIHSPPFGQQARFAFTMANQTSAKAKPLQIERKPNTANRISPKFKPNADCIKQIQQHGIPLDFAKAQLAEFIHYWQQRGEIAHSWDHKFLQRVVKAWQQHKSDLPFALSNQNQAMANAWQPSPDAFDILSNIGIKPDFIKSCIPEFILYWQERGDVTNTWNSKFVQHVKRQWAKFTSTLKFDSEPKLIQSNWQPANEVFDIIAMANIDANFARQQIPEFVLYWQESKQLHNSWNSKFLQHVKHRWAQQHQLQGYANERQQNASAKHQATDFISKHTDTSWAEGI